MQQMKLLLVAACLLVLAGCASSVQRESLEAAGQAGQAGAAVKVKSLSVSLSPEAQKLVADNPKFDQEKLVATVRRMVEARGLVSDAAPANLEIVVTDFRVRSSFTAVMFGVMAGTDSLAGDVVVKDAAGRPIRKFKVSASYGLGGLAGGQDDVRLNWLYEKFGEHTSNELAGVPDK